MVLFPVYGAVVTESLYIYRRDIRRQLFIELRARKCLPAVFSVLRAAAA